MSETWRETARRVILHALDDAREQGLDAAATLALVDSHYPFGAREYYPYKVWLAERKNLVTSPRAPTVRNGRPVFGGAIVDTYDYDVEAS